MQTQLKSGIEEERDSRPSTAYKWSIVGMLWMVCMLNYADRQAIFSIFPLLKSNLQLTDVQLGLAGASFMWVYALVGPLAGGLGDRFSRKRIILGALVFWSMATAATAVCHTFTQLMICRALGGLGEAFYFPAAMSLISDYHGAQTRSRAMALHQSGVYAGTIGGGICAGWIGMHAGWRHVFDSFGLLGIAVAVVLAGLLREPARGSVDEAGIGAPPSSSQPLAQVLRGLLSQRSVMFLILAFVGANFVAMVFLTWMPSYLYRTFGMSLSMAGWNATAYVQGASIMGVLTGGIVADRLRRKHAGARATVQAAGLALGAPFLFLTGYTLSAPVLVAAMSCFGYFKGLYDANIFASLYDVVPVRVRSAVAGLLNSLGWLGGGFAPVLVAAASRRVGIAACLSATSLVYLCCSLLLWHVARAARR